jgi:hypothetical protein
MSWPVLPYGFLATQGSSEDDTYQVSRSLRFNGTSKYLNRTFSVAGNRKTWTWSGWVKRGLITGTQYLFSSNSGASNTTLGLYGADNTLSLDLISGAGNTGLQTTQSFRDPTAWYHIVAVLDTPQATAADRMKLYVNGAQITSFSRADYTSTFNADFSVNNNIPHNIGAGPGNTNFFDGYLAEVNFIDGQALTPSSFGQTESVTGRWRPIAYTGSYGANGFYLPFSDNSAATATTLGKDSAPISGAHTSANNFTPNNLSVTAYATNDSLVDSPTIYGTDTGVGGEVRGNYATLNSIGQFKSTILNGNLSTNAGLTSSFATIGMSSGKWYCEMYVTAVGTESSLGVSRGLNATQYMGASVDSWGYYYSGQKYTNGTGTAYGAAYTTGDTIGAAFDADNGTIIFYKNGVSQGTAFTGLTSGPYFFGCNGRANDVTMNFGQQTYKHAAPSGYKAVCSTNFPTPAILKPNTAMDVVTYTGTGATLTNSSLGFSPDLVWLKSRSAATDHALYDSVRGATFDLSSTSTAAETTQAQGLTSFNASGFTIGTLAKINTASATYVGWAWDESVTDGLDIVTFTGTGVNQNISHNLGVVPKMVIYKCRNNATTPWIVGHSGVNSATSPWNYYMLLNAADAQALSSGPWNNTAPTTTQFTVGGSFTPSTFTYVAYVFAEIPSFSKFDFFTGNASLDGPYIFCGFRPRFVMVKRTDLSEVWITKDSARTLFNGSDYEIYPNLTNAEGGPYTSAAGPIIDFTSNGFKVKSTSTGYNASGGRYIYAAFAESPFKFSRAR